MRSISRSRFTQHPVALQTFSIQCFDSGIHLNRDSILDQSTQVRVFSIEREIVMYTCSDFVGRDQLSHKDQDYKSCLSYLGLPMTRK